MTKNINKNLQLFEALLNNKSLSKSEMLKVVDFIDSCIGGYNEDLLKLMQENLYSKEKHPYERAFKIAACLSLRSLRLKEILSTGFVIAIDRIYNKIKNVEDLTVKEFTLVALLYGLSMLKPCYDALAKTGLLEKVQQSKCAQLHQHVSKCHDIVQTLGLNKEPSIRRAGLFDQQATWIEYFKRFCPSQKGFLAETETNTPKNK